MDIKSNTSVATNQSLNFSKRDKDEVPKLATIAAFIIFINSAVIFLFCRSKPLRRNTSNYLLLSLSICDLMTGAINIPILLACFRTYSKVICLFVNTVHQFTSILTCYHILVITLDRYYAICCPLKKRVTHLKPVYCKVLCVVWISSFIIAFAGHTAENITGLYRPNRTFGIFSLVAIFAIPYTIMVWAYVVMFRRIGRNRKQLSRYRNRASSQTKCLAVFASMAILYAACWIPWYILFFLYRFGTVPANLHVFYEPLTYIRYATSLINPILYTWFKNDFLSELKFLFTSSMRRRPSNSMSTNL